MTDGIAPGIVTGAGAVTGFSGFAGPGDASPDCRFERFRFSSCASCVAAGPASWVAVVAAARTAAPADATRPDDGEVADVGSSDPIAATAGVAPASPMPASTAIAVRTGVVLVPRLRMARPFRVRWLVGGPAHRERDGNQKLSKTTRPVGRRRRRDEHGGLVPSPDLDRSWSRTRES